MADANKTYVMLDKLQYYDTKIKNYVDEKDSTNANAIAVLNGNASQEGSVDAKINAALNAFANATSDDNIVNTLKELVDWVAEHGSEAADFAAAIQANTLAIGEKPVKDGPEEDRKTGSGILKALDDLEASIAGLTGGKTFGSLAFVSKVTDEYVDDASIAIAKITGLADALNKLGSIPNTSSATNLVDYVNEKTNFTYATNDDIDAMFEENATE